jgi:hypothetical protein
MHLISNFEHKIRKKVGVGANRLIMLMLLSYVSWPFIGTSRDLARSLHYYYNGLRNFYSECVNFKDRLFNKNKTVVKSAACGTATAGDLTNGPGLDIIKHSDNNNNTFGSDNSDVHRLENVLLKEIAPEGNSGIILKSEDDFLYKLIMAALKIFTICFSILNCAGGRWIGILDILSKINF